MGVMSRFAGRIRKARNRERIAAVGLSGSALVPWRQVTAFSAARLAATTRSRHDWRGPR